MFMVLSPYDELSQQFTLALFDFVTVEGEHHLEDWTPHIHICQLTLCVDHTCKDG